MIKKSNFLYIIPIAIIAGILIGVGSFTFYYAEGFSYASNDPKACVNCHVMNHQYDSWSSSGHHHVATCNDCHMPAPLLKKLFAKARNGWNHSVAFTLDNYQDAIQVTKPNIEILQANCVRCHATLVTDAILIPAGGSHQAQQCIHCHKHIGHLPIH